MVRLARHVVPGLPHHAIQRSSRCGQTYFEKGHYALYLVLLAEIVDMARAAV
jgi:hypothetical protein